MKVLITFGGGGHTAESLRVLKEIGPGYEYHYLCLEEEPQVRDAVPFPGEFHLVSRPRHRDDSIFRSVIGVTRTFFTIRAIVRAVRPDAIVGCGPSLSVVTMWAGKMYGAKVIFIETAARIRTSSLSAKLTYPIADLFLVQWPEMLRKFSKAEYRGRI